jgi:hypothetical protein
LHANQRIWSIANDVFGNTYAAGSFTNGLGYRYVAKWNGITWTELGSGTNALNANGYIFTLAIDNNIYAAGDFENGLGYRYVAKWDGTSWAELGNANAGNSLNANGLIRTIATDANGNVYAAGNLINDQGKYYVAKWDGTNWTELGSGTNALNANHTINSIVIDANGNVYAAGYFYNTNNIYYVSKWDGTTWAELGTGSNALNANNGGFYSITLDGGGNVYAAGSFKNVSGSSYVAKWDGNSWSELGGTNGINIGPDNDIFVLSTDIGGNVYAGGEFINTNGRRYVSKWNGTFWSELGTRTNALNANDIIFAVATDATGNVYAGGMFTNNTGNYVAKFDQVINDINSVAVNTINNVPAIINTNGGTLPLQAQVFPNTANQTVVWSIVPGTGTASISSSGVVTAISNGTAYAKAVSVANAAKMDSLLITISNQTTSLQDQVKTLGISLYPNPAQQELQLSILQAHKDVQVTIVDITGKQLFKTNYDANTLNSPKTIAINTLSSGIYFLKINGIDVDVTMKFIIE